MGKAYHGKPVSWLDILAFAGQLEREHLGVVQFRMSGDHRKKGRKWLVDVYFLDGLSFDVHTYTPAVGALLPAENESDLAPGCYRLLFELDKILSAKRVWKEGGENLPF